MAESALVGGSSAFIGKLLTELKYWVVDKKPFIFKDSAKRVFLASFAGLVTGGVITKVALYRGWVSDIKYAYEIKGAPDSAYIKPIPTGWHPEPIPVSMSAGIKVNEIGIIGGVAGEYFVDWLDE